MMGRTSWALRRERHPLLTRCSLFQRKRALSNTWKWSESRQRAKFVKSALLTLARWSIPKSSRISSNSFRNRTCFPLQLQGQHLKNPLRIGTAVSASFSAYWMIQYASCRWYSTPTHLGLCKGIKALTRNCKCSSNNFQKFSNTIVALSLIDKSVKDIWDSATNEGTVRHEFSSFQTEEWSWGNLSHEGPLHYQIAPRAVDRSVDRIISLTSELTMNRR